MHRCGARMLACDACMHASLASACSVLPKSPRSAWCHNALPEQHTTCCTSHASPRGRTMHVMLGSSHTKHQPLPTASHASATRHALQIEQKMTARIAEEEEKRMFAEMNETERLKAEQRYLDDKRRERERREATIKVLDQQVRHRRPHRAAGYE